MAVFASDSMSGYLWQNVVDTARTGGANWTHHPISGGVFRIFENRAYCETAGAIYHKTAPPSADYAVQASYYIWTDEGTEGIAGRISTSAISYYTAYMAGGVAVLGKMLAGSFSVLDTGAVDVTPGTHTLRLEMVGTAIGVIWDGVTVCTATDGDITAKGYAGIRSSAPNDARRGKHIDYFFAADDTTLALGSSQVMIVGI